MDLHTLNAVVKIIDEYITVAKDDIAVCSPEGKACVKQQIIGADDIKQLVKGQIDSLVCEMDNQYNEEEDQLYV
jgi:hypothetical protein